MKYIDADRLEAEIEKHIKEVKDAAERFTPNLGFFDAKLSGIYDVMAIIDSLQQVQPEVNYDDAVSQFVKIPYTGERWFSTTDGEFIAGALFEEPIPADAELYYKKEDKK